MLLPFVVFTVLANVIAKYMNVADVITTKADVIAFCIVYGVGWCYCQFYCNVVADVIAKWQML